MSNLIQNRRVFFDYEVLEKLEAGISLLGLEVKALKAGQGNLSGSHVIIRGREAFLINMEIPPYQANNTPKDYDPKRHRKLLLNKDEISKLSKLERQTGLTIVPISVYNTKRNLKVEIGIVRGKKQRDKRESIKQRETDREIRRTLKN